MLINLAFFVLLFGLAQAIPNAERLAWASTLISSDPQNRPVPNVIAPINLQNTTHVAGYSVDFWYLFMTGRPDEFNWGTVGIAPRPDRDDGKSVLRASFTTWYPGTVTDDPNCHYGDVDAGEPVVACSTDFVGFYDHTYHLHVQKVTGSVFIALALDTVTGIEAYIGSIAPPEVSGIWPGFFEGYGIFYLPWEHGTSYPCDKLPWLLVDIGTPSTSASFADPSMWPPIEESSCRDSMNYHASKTQSGYSISLGFPDADAATAPSTLFVPSVADQIPLL